ncbi:YadA-like family protein [Moraxella nasovis]|uniref:YadA-like family protein n=1 Tax=Moraxella nasovis TaxID=2904121 RepID=UPI001F604EF9|nr:YadA-like family protein [Moraxella nasovis]UNU72945.1 YadA-like family protein [Moraxella nasovis]
MNKIYKIVWNSATATWTVVSEYARGKGKTKSAKKLALAVATTAMLSGTAMAQASSAVKTDNQTIKVNQDGNIAAITGGLTPLEETNDRGTQFQNAGGGGSALMTVGSVATALNSMKLGVKAEANGGAATGNEKTAHITLAGTILRLKAGEGIKIDQANRDTSFTFSTIPEPRRLLSNNPDNGVVSANTPDLKLPENLQPLDELKTKVDEATGPKLNRLKPQFWDKAIDYVNTLPLAERPENWANLNEDDQAVAAEELVRRKLADEKAKIAAAKQGLDNQLTTAATVRDAINNSGFLATSSKSEGGEIDEANKKDHLIKTGETLTLDAGKNMKIVQKDGKFTFATKAEVEFDKVTSKEVVVPTKDEDNPNAAPITINKDGIKAGNKAITNVAGNLAGAKEGTQAPTIVGTAPADKDTIKNNAATVGDVLNAGFNLKVKNGNTAAQEKDFVTAYDNVIFADGSGTIASVVVSDEGKTSTIKYDVNAGDGIEVVDGKVKVKPKTENNKNVSGLIVDTNGVSVNVDNSTITIEDGKLKANFKDTDTNNITTLANGNLTTVKDSGTDGNHAYEVNVTTADITSDPATGAITAPKTDGVATAINVANAIKNAGFKLTSSAEGGEKDTGSIANPEIINPADTVEMVAGKNLTVKQEANGKITYATKSEVEFDKVTSKEVVVPTKDEDNPNAAPITINKDGIKAGNKAITNVAGNLAGAKEGTQAPTIVGTAPADKDTIKNNAATVGDVLNAGFNLKVKNGNTAAQEKDFVTAYDNVIFADGSGTIASVVVSDEGKTSTIKYDVNAGDGIEVVDGKVKVKPKTENNKNVSGLIVDTNGVSVNVDNSTITIEDGKLKANFKDTDTNNITTLANGNLTTVKDSGTDGNHAYEVNVTTADITSDPATGAITAPKTDGVATAINVANAIKNAGFKLTSSAEGGEKDTGSIANPEIINPADTVEMVAGKNLTVKQEANGKITYATKSEVEFDKVTSKEVVVPTKDEDNPNAAPITINKDGIKAGNKAITNVAGNLAGAKEGTQAPTIVGTAPADKDTIKNNAATVGDVLNAGFNLKVKNGNTAAQEKDFVTAYDNVIFADGSGTTASVETDGKTSTIKYDVNAGNGLEVGTDGNLTVKPKAKGGITVDGDGVSVNVDNSTITIEDGKLKANFTDTNTVTTLSDGNLTTVVDTPENGNHAYKVNVTTADITSDPATGAITDPKTDGVATAINVANAIKNSGFKLTSSAEGGEKDTGSIANPEIINPADTVEMVAGKNLTVKQEANGKITYATKDDVSFNSVNIGDAQVTLTSNINEQDGGRELSVGTKTSPTRITNVAPGINTTDAVNVGQLNHMANMINNRIGDVENNANAGVSSSMAMATLPQAYIPGKSMLTGGIASYNGQGAVAVGFSKLSDNGRWVLKMSGSADTQGNAGGAVGAGFHF